MTTPLGMLELNEQELHGFRLALFMVARHGEAMSAPRQPSDWADSRRITISEAERLAGRRLIQTATALRYLGGP